MCVLNGQAPSVDKFHAWVATVRNPNVKMMLTLLNLAAAIMLHRIGIRRNNADSIMAGRRVFAPIWFVRNHPKYCEIAISDQLDRYRYPSDLADHVNHETFSKSGDPSKGESPDFLLENANKAVKNLVPPHLRSTTGNELATVLKSFLRSVILIVIYYQYKVKCFLFL